MPLCKATLLRRARGNVSMMVQWLYLDLQQEREAGVSVGDVACLSAVLCLHQLLDHPAHCQALTA